jgi:thiamine-phosphate pyrophosphorylase
MLVHGMSSIQEFANRVEALIAAGVHAIQLRDKSLDDRELAERARILRQLTQGSHVLFIVNDRPDIAVVADADGIHVGQEDLSVEDVRRVVGADRLIGVSTHSLEQARQAVSDRADYIGCGPTFPSTTKDFERFAGVGLLRDVSRQIKVPAFAIGGVGRDNLDQVLDAGFRRIAVSGAVLNAEDPAAEIAALLEQLTAT